MMDKKYGYERDVMSAVRAHKLAAVLAGAVLLFMIGCTPDSSSSSSGSSNSSGTSTDSQVASKTILVTGGANDPAPDPPGDPSGDPVAGDPGTDPPGDESSASCPEPATGLLFLCAAGSMALARLRARQRA
jgi:hypothetical protein